MTRPSFRTSLLAICLTVLTATSAVGVQRDTWKLLKNFGKTIGCGFFFDKDHGLIGSGVRPATYFDRRINEYVPYLGTDVSIYKTTDGGQTWKTCILPRTINGAVTSISMIDSLHGYASIFSTLLFDDNNTFGKSALWETTDGGDTWFDTLHLDHVITSVYAQHGLLLYTKWDKGYANFSNPSIDGYGGAYSFDNGKNWTHGFSYSNGVAFSDSLNGVVTELNQSNGLGFWRTTDAGRSWSATSGAYESWSVYAVAGKHIFFCANESQPRLPHNSVNWSTDSGATWHERTYFPVMHFTGTIDGKGSTLYIQTDTAYYDSTQLLHGMYRSDDLGGTWHWVGGPSNSRDTRFVVTGCSGEVVYAFDTGNVWKTEDGGDGTLPGGNPNDASFLLNADYVAWTPSPCGDTITFTATSSSCVPLTIDSIGQVNGSELLLIRDTSLPRALQQNDSSQFRFAYSATRGGASQSVFRVFAHAGTRTIVRDATVDIDNPQRSGIILSKSSLSMSVGGCSSIVDTVRLVNLGCPGMILDSVVLPAGDITVLNSFPDSISDVHTFPLRFAFSPDSAGVHQVSAQVFAHTGRHRYDTLITITATSDQRPLTFQLDSASLHFKTKYCQPLQSRIVLGSSSCDTLRIDSVQVSNPSFSVAHSHPFLASRESDSLTVTFAPNSSGTAVGHLRVFAHTRVRSIDTTIPLDGSNFVLPQALTVSRPICSLDTKACQPISDTLHFSNQSCDPLFLDSVVYGNGELVLSYDSSKTPLASNDSLEFRLQFSPSDGIPKTTSIHVYFHSTARTFDTLLTVYTSNTIAPKPLALTSDSLFLWTKYCQPVSIPLSITNFGCPTMRIDTAIILDDARGEFRIDYIPHTLLSQAGVTTTVYFSPDTEGSRIVHIKLITFGDAEIDTILTVSGKNLVAPSPYIPALPTKATEEILRVPIMLHVTKDTFTIQSFAVHLRFNTDLLTPYALDFFGTCARHVKSSSLTLEPGNGASIRIVLSDTISDTSQLSLPLVYVLDSVRVAPDTSTMIAIDTFVTDREPALELCTIPGELFTFSKLCSDPLFRDLLETGTVQFDFIRVSPNPASNEKDWRVQLKVDGHATDLSLDAFDARGIHVSAQHLGMMEIGLHDVSVPLPPESGDYLLVLHDERHQILKKMTVRR